MTYEVYIQLHLTSLFILTNFHNRNIYTIFLYAYFLFCLIMESNFRANLQRNETLLIYLLKSHLPQIKLLQLFEPQKFNKSIFFLKISTLLWVNETVSVLFLKILNFNFDPLENSYLRDLILYIIRAFSF